MTTKNRENIKSSHCMEAFKNMYQIIHQITIYLIIDKIEEKHK